MKRLLSGFLCLVMLLSLTVSVSAIKPREVKSLICLDREYNFLSKAEYTDISSSNNHAAMIRSDGSL